LLLTSHATTYCQLLDTTGSRELHIAVALADALAVAAAILQPLSQLRETGFDGYCRPRRIA
jgi:hypothetical protein